MYTTRPQVFYETSRDKRQKFSHQLNHYSDYGVLIGRWFDDRAHAEAETEILLHKLAKNQLGFQKLERYCVSLNRPVELTRNLDGFVHHGDLIRLKCSNSSNQVHFLAALPFSVSDSGIFEEPCLATATRDTTANARCVFHVFRNNNQIPNHIPLMYGECILICTADGTGHRLLNCEPRSFANFARKSGHQEVKWVTEMSGRSLWKVLLATPANQKRTEGLYIPSNTDVVIRNLATGENLAVEHNTKMKTVMGTEKEVAGHTYMDRRKVFGVENLWQFEAPFISPEDYGQPIKLPQTIHLATQ